MTGEVPAINRAEQMIRARISTYRDGAGGWVDVHTYSLDGVIQRECTTHPEMPVDEISHRSLLVGYDGEGNQVALHYDGVMAFEACAAFAYNLEQQLNAINQ